MLRFHPSRACRRPAVRSVLAIVAAALVILASGPGCIFLVGGEPDVQTSVCHFQGEATTPCGECIASHCQPQVNACCADGSCKSNLSSLDSCATAPSGSGAYSCDTLTSTYLVYPPSQTFDDLGTCVMTSCGVCTGTDASAPPNPGGGAGVFCTEQNGECGCLPSSTSGASGSCSASMFAPAGICCAPSGWPTGSGQLACLCAPFSCTVSDTDCFCSASAGGSDPSLCPTGLICCASSSSGTCACSADPCQDTDTQVEDCTPASTGCSSGDFMIDSCSGG